MDNEKDKELEMETPISPKKKGKLDTKPLIVLPLNIRQDKKTKKSDTKAPTAPKAPTKSTKLTEKSENAAKSATVLGNAKIPTVKKPSKVKNLAEIISLNTEAIKEQEQQELKEELFMAENGDLIRKLEENPELLNMLQVSNDADMTSIDMDELINATNEDITIEILDEEPTQVEDITIETLNEEPTQVEDITIETLNEEPTQVEDIAIETLNEEPTQVEDITIERLDEEPTQVEDITIETLNEEPTQVEDIAIEILDEEPTQVEDIAIEILKEDIEIQEEKLVEDKTTDSNDFTQWNENVDFGITEPVAENAEKPELFNFSVGETFDFSATNETSDFSYFGYQEDAKPAEKEREIIVDEASNDVGDIEQANIVTKKDEKDLDYFTKTVQFMQAEDDNKSMIANEDDSIFGSYFTKDELKSKRVDALNKPIQVFSEDDNLDDFMTSLNDEVDDFTPEIAEFIEVPVVEKKPPTEANHYESSWNNMNFNPVQDEIVVERDMSEKIVEPIETVAQAKAEKKMKEKSYLMDDELGLDDIVAPEIQREEPIVGERVAPSVAIPFINFTEEVMPEKSPSVNKVKRSKLHGYFAAANVVDSKKKVADYMVLPPCAPKVERKTVKKARRVLGYNLANDEKIYKTYMLGGNGERVDVTNKRLVCVDYFGNSSINIKKVVGVSGMCDKSFNFIKFLLGLILLGVCAALSYGAIECVSKLPLVLATNILNIVRVLIQIGLFIVAFISLIVGLRLIFKSKNSLFQIKIFTDSVSPWTSIESRKKGRDSGGTDFTIRIKGKKKLEIAIGELSTAIMDMQEYLSEI